LRDRVQERLGQAFPALHDITIPALARTTLEWFCFADLLAEQYRRMTDAVQFRLSLLLFLCGGFQCMVLLSSSTALFMTLYVGSLVGAYAMFAWARYNKYEIRYLDYRALAEALRVRVYWSIAGIDTPVADVYLRKQRSEIDWIRHAVRNDALMTSDLLARACASAFDSDLRLRMTAAQWMQAARTYYRTSSRRNREVDLRLRNTGSVLFFLGLGLAALQVFVPVFPASIQSMMHGSALPLLLGFMGIAQLGGALMFNHADKRGYADHAKRYARMEEVLGVADRRVKLSIERRRFDDVRELLYLAGKELLMESGDWLLAHRERPLEVPKTN
jgi:hypothetical protein